jgi:hypothetical protein
LDPIIVGRSHYSANVGIRAAIQRRAAGDLAECAMRERRELVIHPFGESIVPNLSLIPLIEI